MSELPTDVADGENIARAIKTPHHVTKKNTLRPAAFKPKAGTDDLSVMRLGYLGADACKDKAVEIAGSEYVGLCVIRASSIRGAGSDVFDSREEFWGHAHISHGIVIQPNEPLSAEDNEWFTERLRKLVTNTTYYPDPVPTSAGWSGPPLLPPAV